MSDKWHYQTLAIVRAERISELEKELTEAKATIAALEQARPHWAQGYTDDSVAAQCATGALSSVWKELGVTNQTDAMRKLKEMNK